MRGLRSGGFTLIELVVAIAILAVLSGVGVTAYGAYMERGELKAEQIALDNLRITVDAVFADEPVPPYAIKVIDSPTVTVEAYVESDGVESIYPIHDPATDLGAEFAALYVGDLQSLDLKNGTTAVWSRDDNQWTISGESE